MANSRNYVYNYLDFISKQNIARVLLPDTLGVLTPEMTSEYLSELVNRYPNIHLTFTVIMIMILVLQMLLEAVKAGLKEFT